MCQVNDDTDMMIMKDDRLDISMTSCMKCSEAAVVIARVKDPFCRNCFLAYVTHRFKATIGKSRLIRDKEKVVVAFSGGQNSSAVARLVHEGRSESQHKKFRFVPSLVYIDDGVITRQTDEERRMTRTAVTRLMQEYDFSSCVVPFEEVLKLTSTTETTIDVSNTNSDNDVAVVTNQLGELHIKQSSSQQLLEILDSAKSLTAKEDLIQTLRQRLLAAVARQQGHTKVMLGVNGTRLASYVLSGMAQGRGVTVPLEVGFADDRDGDISFVRPLREFPSREITMYNHFTGVESICIPTLTTKAGPYASINALTSDFINGLQTNFPSTVSTVLRTGEKLCTIGKSGEEKDCVMCKAPLDTDVPSCSALESTQHSLSVSGHGVKPPGQCASSGGEGSGGAGGECCGQGDGSCHSTTRTISSNEISRWLCYGCRITLREMKSTDFLPGYVLEEAGRRQRRSEMKDEIQDFLLVDEDR